MIPNHISLPTGTSVFILPSHVIFELNWAGKTGRHVVHLAQSLGESEGAARDEALLNAMELFRNVVGLEVIDDALHSGDWPPAGVTEISLDPIDSDSFDRTRDD